MELFERVRIIFKDAEKEGKSLPDQIGVNLNTFKGYLKVARQDNLWPLLPRILREYPQISREWLYFDEGDMLRGDEPQKDLEELATLREENRLLKNKYIAVLEEMNTFLRLREQTASYPAARNGEGPGLLQEDPGLLYGQGNQDKNGG